MLRHTPAIVRDAPGFLATMRDTYGDVVQFPIPRPPTYLVASAAGTQQVLVRRPGVTTRTPSSTGHCHWSRATDYWSRATSSGATSARSCNRPSTTASCRTWPG